MRGYDMRNNNLLFFIACPWTATNNAINPKSGIDNKEKTKGKIIDTMDRPIKKRQNIRSPFTNQWAQC